MKFWNFHHLKDAFYYSNSKENNIIIMYFIHFYRALENSLFFLFVSLLFFLHAIFPPLSDFFLVEALVNKLKKFKDAHPNDPILSKIDFKK
jgi:hypothetical protein